MSASGNPLEGVFSITCHWQLKCYCRLIIDYNRSVLIEISNIFIYIYTTPNLLCFVLLESCISVMPEHLCALHTIDSVWLLRVYVLLVLRG